MAKRKRPWNKGKIVGRKPPLSPEQVATIRTLLSQDGNLRNIAMFALAIDSSLRGVDIRLHRKNLITRYSPSI